MNIKDLEAIELKYNFKYPSLYKQLCNDGMLNTGKYGAEWHNTVYPIIKESPTLLLYAYDFELVEDSMIDEEIEMIKDPDYPGFNSDLKLIPFAKSGAGDWICFYLNQQQAENIPIAFVWHDGGEFDIKAQNLQDYIFREMLDATTRLDVNSLINKDLEKTCSSWLNTHQKYLKEQQNNILKEIYSRPVQEYIAYKGKPYEEKAKGLLTLDEFEKIIKEEIDFPLLNQSLPLF